MKKYKNILEIVLSFLIIDGINGFLFKGDPGFLNASIHPYWVIILLVSCRYGFLSGFFSGSIACLHVLFFAFQEIPARVELEQYFEAHGFILPAAFIITGIILGGLREKYRVQEEEKTFLLEKLQKEQKKLKQQVEVGDKARKLLESRIVGETTTVKTLYETARRFEDLDIENIYRGCLEILTEYLHVEKSSLYLIEKENFVLKTSQGTIEKGAEGKVAVKDSIMSIILEEKELITAQDLLNHPKANQYQSQYGDILAMIPLKNNEDRVIGVVAIEQMDFLHFHSSNLQLMQLIVGWASKALINKQLYNATKEKLIFDERDGIYYFHYLDDVLSKEFERAKTYDLDLSLIVVKLDQFGFLDPQTQKLLERAVIAVLKRSVSSLDMIFRYKYDGMFIAVCPMTTSEKVTRLSERFVNDFHKIIQSEKSSIQQPKILIGEASVSNTMNKSDDLVAYALETAKKQK